MFIEPKFNKRLYDNQ